MRSQLSLYLATLAALTISISAEVSVLKNPLLAELEGSPPMTLQTVDGFPFEIGTKIYLQDKSEISVAYAFFRKGRLPDDLLDNFVTPYTWDLLTKFFRHSKRPSRRLESSDDWNTPPLDFQWALPPSRNHHSGSFNFYLLIRREALQFMYFKIIFPTTDGFLALEIIGEHNDSKLELAKKMIENTSLSEELEKKVKEQPIIRTTRWGELLLLPSDRQETPSQAVLLDQSYLEENRKSAGLLFLLLSIAFFIFVAPKITK